MKRALTFCLIALAACKSVERRSFHVGEHRIAAAVAEGWEPVEQGRQFLLRKSEQRVTSLDLGPVQPEALRDEVIRARELWRSGQKREAQTMLDALPGRNRFEAYENYEPLFDRMLEAIDALDPIPLPEMAKDALERVGHDDSRWEVKSMSPVRVDGREAMNVETWMRLTHSDPRRLLVILNDGRLLTIRCERCDADTLQAFDRFVTTLQFEEAPRK